MALRTFSFAKQRFDSTATPMMRYCCLIRAIAILCAMQACDVPHLQVIFIINHFLAHVVANHTFAAQARGSKEVRLRAERALLNMVPDKLMRCGLTADYTLEVLSFLRQNFDTDDPDVALIPLLLKQFRERMQNLFVKGWILAPDTAVQSDKPESKTMTQIVFEQVDCPEPMLRLDLSALFQCPHVPKPTQHCSLCSLLGMT